MTRSISLLFAMAAIAGTGCIFPLMPMDGGFRVSGELVDIRGMPLHGCTIELHSEGGEILWEPMEVSSNFKESFTVAPGRATYVLDANCPGFKNSSFSVQYGKEVSPSSPLDLGRVVLTKVEDDAT